MNRNVVKAELNTTNKPAARDSIARNSPTAICSLSPADRHRAHGATHTALAVCYQLLRVPC